MGVGGVAAILKRKRDDLTDAEAKNLALAAEATQQTAAIESLNQQVAQLQAELASTQAAKAQLEADAQKHAEELEVIDQKTADLQAQLNASEAANLKLQDELGALQEQLTATAVPAAADKELSQTEGEVTPVEGEATAAGVATAATDEGSLEVSEAADLSDAR